MLLNLHNWFIRRNERKKLYYDKVIRTTKSIENDKMLVTKMHINQGIGIKNKVKYVKAKGQEKFDTKKRNMHVIDPKDLKWITKRFEKIDSTLKTMKEHRNIPSN